MADRVDFYFQQRVSEAELDLAFEQLEQADHDLAADLKIHGIISGAVPMEHAPVADLSIDLTSPTRAYDHLGQRIYIGTDQRIDCAVDFVGRLTQVNSPGNEKWLGVFLKFERKLADPRIDGNSKQIYFRRDESFQIIVRQAPEMPGGTGLRTELAEDELLLCDLRLVHGQTQLKNADINLNRRQAFVFADASAVSVESGLWRALTPQRPTVQSALDAADAWLARLSSPAGTGQVGAAGIPGAPTALSAGSLAVQLAAILTALNAHQSAPRAAHAASSIAATPDGLLSGTDVQDQLQEILTILRSEIVSKGDALIGEAAIKGASHSIIAGTVRSQLSKLLSLHNEHLAGGDHDGRYVRESFSCSETFKAGEAKVVATLDAQPALVTVAYSIPNKKIIDQFSHGRADKAEALADKSLEEKSFEGKPLPRDEWALSSDALSDRLTALLSQGPIYFQGTAHSRLRWWTKPIFTNGKTIDLAELLLGKEGKLREFNETELAEILAGLKGIKWYLHVENGSDKKLVLHVKAWGGGENT